MIWVYWSRAHPAESSQGSASESASNHASPVNGLSLCEKQQSRHLIVAANQHMNYLP